MAAELWRLIGVTRQDPRPWIPNAAESEPLVDGHGTCVLVVD